MEILHLDEIVNHIEIEQAANHISLKKLNINYEIIMYQRYDRQCTIILVQRHTFSTRLEMDSISTHSNGFCAHNSYRIGIGLVSFTFGFLKDKLESEKNPNIKVLW